MQKGNIGVTTENIFPVIKKFLYSDHEIFLRELVSNAGGYVRRNVMPMEAFFVMTPDGQAKSEMTVTFNANMQTTDAGTTSTVTRSLPSDPFLRLSATLDGHTTHALLRVSPTASAASQMPFSDTPSVVAKHSCDSSSSE